MTSFALLRRAGATAALLALAVPGPARDGPAPNVVLVFADDLGYGDLGAYGHPQIRTPRLDRLAREGVRFTSFYAAAPFCTPSRAALLTGRFPVRFGMPGNLGPDSPGGLPAEERTLAEALRDQGYRTAAIGKWHLGSVPGHLPTDHGFDEYFGLLYSNDMIPPWVDTERPLHLYRGDRPTPEQPVDQATLTRRYTEEAVRFIESADEPFLLYLPHSMPHLPLAATARFLEGSRGGRYGAVVEELDWSVGRLLDALDARGIDDRTLFVFTSDNGPWRNLPPRMYDSDPVERWDAGSTGPLRGAKATTWEGGHRVPAIVRWPGRIPAGTTVGGIATTMDLHATVLALAGAAPPPRPLDGADIWPVLTEGAASPHEHFHYFLGSRLEAVRDARWKLRIARPASDWISPELDTGDEPVEVQLFDLWSDPYERFDVAADNPDRVEALRRELRAFAEETGAELAPTP